MSKKPLDDLKAAILAVLQDTTILGLENGTMHLYGLCGVPTKLLLNLQAEYNIHFVEANETQVNVL